jgi:dTDP-4-amino-4,6-dideoxygalactose transaminase
MIKLSKAFIGTEEADMVRDVLCDEQYLGMGKYVRLFEAEIAEVLGLCSNHHVVSTGTGTHALQLALQAAGVGEGDEVLVPTITYVASFQAIHATGAKAIACDVLLRHGGLDVKDAKKRLTPATKAIMTVHYAGGVGDIDGIYAFAKDHGLRVVEDSAHAFGSTHPDGLMVGAKGDIVCFSFDSIKNITCGEGGAVVTGDGLVAKRCQDLRLLGVQNDTAARYSGKRSWDFDVQEQGWRYHLNNVHAAIGLAQLKKFSFMKEKRQALMAMYHQHLKDIDLIALFDLPVHALNPHIMPIRCLKNRNELRGHLLDHGVETGLHYKPNHLLTFFDPSKVSNHHPFPVAQQLYQELMTLPLHPGVREEDVIFITDLIKNFYGA